MGYRPKRLLELLAVVAEIAGDFQACPAAASVVAVMIGIELVPAPVQVLDFVIEIVTVETGSSVDLERKPAAQLVKIAAVRTPAEIQDMVMTEMGGGQQACYLPVVPLEP